ncbi:ABC transporter ATP-binding protein [Terrarubrum flagellatum]|uniref:ABC transporter ATP-binding protein n=1 Tax=Terrirubrum flagellatum TaxID=2895980 RepID=UPI0031456C41
MSLLVVSEITKTFGGLKALDDVSFSLAKSEILGLVGPNGSGKSTMINVLSGVYHPDAGDVKLSERSLLGRKPSFIAKSGLARTFQNLQLFAGLSAVENVVVGRDCRMRSGLLAGVFGLPGSRNEERAAIDIARSLLRDVGLGAMLDVAPSSLSYGQRRLLEVARALASEPRVLMLDEPCAGLSQGETDELAALVRKLATKGMAIIVIEHNMRFVMNLVDRIVALNFGRKIAEGTPETIRNDAAVIEAYLGRRDHARRR